MSVTIDLTTLQNYSSLEDGTYNITVIAKGNPNLYIDSDPSNAVSWTKTSTLSAPTISVSDGYLLMTDTDGNATGFDLYIDGVYDQSIVKSTPSTNLELSTLSISTGSHTLTVKATASGYQDSVASNSITYSKLSAPTNISFNNSTKTVSFDKVDNATKYKVYSNIISNPFVGEIPQQQNATVSYDITQLSNFSALSNTNIYNMYLRSSGDPDEYQDSVNSGIFQYLSGGTPSISISGDNLTTTLSLGNAYSLVDSYIIYATESGNTISTTINTTESTGTLNRTYDLSQWLTTAGTYSIQVKVHYSSFNVYSSFSNAVSYTVTPSVGYTLSFSNSYEVQEGASVENCSLYVNYLNGTSAEVPLEQSTARGTSYNDVESITLSASDSTYIEYVMGGVTSDLYTVEGVASMSLTNDCTITYCDGQSCIAADTLVLMADGTQKQLGQIHTGDYILSYDWDTMQLVPNKVIYASCEEPDWNTGRWDAPRYFKRTFSDGTVIKQAFAHRFYNREEKRFVYMEQWNLGQHTYAYNNGDGKLVEYVNSEIVYEPIRFARITGENGTNYFANGLLTGDRHCPQNLILPPEDN